MAMLQTTGNVPGKDEAQAFEKARDLIYSAHEQDPNTITTADGTQVPYEVHYSRKMEAFLQKRTTNATFVLQLAICGQHFKRWEVPRNSFPMTRVGYHSWRTHLKKIQAKQVAAILEECGFPPHDVERCRLLIEKDGLKKGEEEVQILEDVACLVFLDDQFDEFKEKHDDAKIISILQKTWVKMSKLGQDMALELPMTDECRDLVAKALAG